jgi:hypothetical protein
MNLLHFLGLLAVFFHLLPDRAPLMGHPRMFRRHSQWVARVEQPFLVPKKLQDYPVQSSDVRVLEAELRTM